VQIVVAEGIMWWDQYFINDGDQLQDHNLNLSLDLRYYGMRLKKTMFYTEELSSVLGRKPALEQHDVFHDRVPESELHNHEGYRCLWEKNSTIEHQDFVTTRNVSPGY
jgi:Na+-transporting NADH:ubiquinone oxidoreductase subunit NqrF